jgi:hypothetical protein
MIGFDHDDNIQQAIALLVLVMVVTLALVVAPTSKIVILLLWGIAGFAMLWYLLIAKGIFNPLGWIDGIRAIAKYMWQRR